jgi:hypothetical protein
MENPFRRKKTVGAYRPEKKGVAYYHEHPRDVPPVTHRRIKWMARRRQ